MFYPAKYPFFEKPQRWGAVALGNDSKKENQVSQTNFCFKKGNWVSNDSLRILEDDKINQSEYLMFYAANLAILGRHSAEELWRGQSAY